MSIAPESQAAQDHDALSIQEIMGIAISRWETLTGVKMDKTGFSWGELDVRQMNEMIREALALEPEGLTAFMMMEVFLRYYLEGKTFTAAGIMKNYAATTEFLARAEELFTITQSDRAATELGLFRNRVAAGLKHYGADRPDVLDVLNDNDVLPFLRRDALESLNSLKPYQFLAGAAGKGPAQVIHHVYQAWDINELLISLRDMPVNGIAVVLLRNPSNPDRSYFAFAMRNGENVTIFTDKTKPAYPGQEDVLAQRGGRGTGRAYARRAWANHFPYQLIKTEVDEDGDIHFTPETAPVMGGQNLVPLMRISDLPPHQAIWLTMMLSLVSEKFWKDFWQAEALSYTGNMIRKRDLLVADHDGAKLPVAAGYRPIELEPVTKADIGAAVLAQQVEHKQTGVNEWLVQRYQDQVPDDLLNIWFTEGGKVALLPSAEKDDAPSWDRKRNAELISAADRLPGGALMVAESKRTYLDPGIPGYRLATFSPTDFGSEEELRADRLFIARKNFAAGIQKAADEEFRARREEVAAWYKDALEANRDGLFEVLALERAGASLMPHQNGDYARFIVADRNSNEWSYTHGGYNSIGNEIFGQHRRACLVTGAETANTRVRISPLNARDIAVVTGLEHEQLPDVLQNWRHDKPYTGNNLLDRIDPVESDIRDPWMKFATSINFYLSKRALKLLEKRVEAIKAELE